MQILFTFFQHNLSTEAKKSSLKIFSFFSEQFNDLLTSRIDQKYPSRTKTHTALQEMEAVVQEAQALGLLARQVK